MYSKLDKDIYEDAIRINFCRLKIDEFPDYKDWLDAEEQMHRRRLAGFDSDLDDSLLSDEV